jgi:hypothetical protein
MQTGITKEYLKEKYLCRVTFRCPRIAAPDARNVYLLLGISMTGTFMLTT